MLIHKLGRRGDTIVEVMIVLAVLGMALSIGYATASRSLSNTRQAQENSEATAIVQSQIEALRKLSGEPATSPGFIFDKTVPFCVKDLSSANPIETTLANCNFGQNSLYSIRIYNCDKLASLAGTPCTSNTNVDQFIAQAKWDDVSGDGNQDSVTISYRVHQP